MKVLENPEVNFAVGNGDLWEPFKTLELFIHKVIRDPHPERYLEEFELKLRSFRPALIHLGELKTKNAAERSELHRLMNEGMISKSGEPKEPFSKQLVSETLLLSDLFNINEFLALDLLTTAEMEMENYCGWPRGLIAVYLFFEGKNSLLQCLVTMMQITPGRTWSSIVPATILAIFKSVLDEAVEEDLMSKLLKLYEKSNLKIQLDRLESSLALGDWRHRSEVTRLIKSIRVNIGMLLYCWSSQRQMSWSDTKRLFSFLKSQFSSPERKLEKGDIFIIMSVVNCLEGSMNFDTIDKTFVSEMKSVLKIQEIVDNQPMTPYYEIIEFFKLIFLLTATKLMSETHLHSNTTSSGIYFNEQDILSEDEEFDSKHDIFGFLHRQLFNPSKFDGDELLMSKMHTILVEFIMYMPLKITEMKNRSEDAARTALLYSEQGISRPHNSCEDYENFLECLGIFYRHDDCKLAAEYFDSDARSLALNRLIKSATIDSPFMYISNVKLMTGLAHSFPNGIFQLLRQNGHNLSFDHFFESIMKYLSSFGDSDRTGKVSYNSDAYNRVIKDPMKVAMNPTEIVSICSYLDLLSILCERSEDARCFFVNTKVEWITLMLRTTKIKAIPREIRGKFLNACSCIIALETSNPEAASNIWQIFYSIRLINKSGGDIKDELEEKETRLESYHLTLGMLKLMKSLIYLRFKDVNDGDPNASFVLEAEGFEPYLSFLVDSVYMKSFIRGYKSDSEKWEIATTSLSIIISLLDYVSKFMLQLLSNSPLLIQILDSLLESVLIREKEVDGFDFHSMNLYTLECLKLIKAVLQRQNKYLVSKNVPGENVGIVVIGLHELLMTLRKGLFGPGYISSVIRFVDILYPEEHRGVALEILYLIVSGHSETDSLLYSALQSDKAGSVVFKNTFLQTLYNPSAKIEQIKKILAILRKSISHYSPNLALYLLGVDAKIMFSDPSSSCPRNVLHAILDNIYRLPDVFSTLLVLIKDSRTCNPLLRYLRSTQFFVKFLIEGPSLESMNREEASRFLYCLAIELKTAPVTGQSAKALIGPNCWKLHEILSSIDLHHASLELPQLEFFDVTTVREVLKRCEYHDKTLKTNLIHLSEFDSILRDDLRHLETASAIRFRSGVQSEARNVAAYARQLNDLRRDEGTKILFFDGWRQCLEVLVLSNATTELAGIDFISSMLRLLILKITNTSNTSDLVKRYTAETILTLCCAMKSNDQNVDSATLNFILDLICKWINVEHGQRIRALLYASVLYILTKYRSLDDTSTTCASCFRLIVENMSRDCCQSHELGRLQAMYLMGEMIRLNTNRGLGGTLSSIGRASFSPQKSASAETSMVSGGGDMKKSYLQSTASLGRQTSFGTNAVLNLMHSKGFLANLIDSTVQVDDSDLLQLFSTDAQEKYLKALYVFEAKMLLLCHFSAVNSKATWSMISTNIVNKLASMGVFKLRFFQDATKSNRPLELDTFAESFLTRKTIMETLYCSVFRVFHVMIDSVKKNTVLIHQIWNFISTHDDGIAMLVSNESIKSEKPNTFLTLLTSLLVKLADNIPSNIVVNQLSTFQKMLSILKLETSEDSCSEFHIALIANILVFLHHFSYSKCNAPQQKNASKIEFQMILRPKFEYNIIVENKEENLSILVLLKIVENTIKNSVGFINMPERKKYRKFVRIIVEACLSLIYFQSELILDGSKFAAKQYRKELEEFTYHLSDFIENKLSKTLSEFYKVLASGETEFMESMLLRIRFFLARCNRNLK